MVSRDGGLSFRASNRGFSHRQVTAVVVDRNDQDRLYTSLINNREFGGVFFSTDGGANWSALDSGLGTRDVFSLHQADNGALVVGTNRGIFKLESKGTTWKPISTVLREKVTTVPVRSTKKKGAPKTTERREWVKSEITGRVSELTVGSGRWYAATSQGLFRSLDAGKSWTGGPVSGATDFIAVDSVGQTVFAATPTVALLSTDGGDNWSELKLPTFVSRVFTIAMGPQGELWIMTHLGSFRSKDNGGTWEHVTAGRPLTNLSFVTYDQQDGRVIAIAGARDHIYESRDGGSSWTLTTDSHWPIHNLSISSGRIYAVTDFNGVVSQRVTETNIKAGGGGN